jgi:serine/threonine protein kinase
MAEFTARQSNQLAEAHFHDEGVRCPNCSGPVDVREVRLSGRPNVDLLLSCRRCGTGGGYSTAHLSEMNLQWTVQEKIRIVEGYWANHFARCPNDRVRLSIKELQLSSGPTLLVVCNFCGRNFSSSELDKQPDPDSFEGKYQVVRELGKGGMGSVSLVRRLGDQGFFAAKRILPDFFADADIVRRFRREERVMRTLLHPRVVRVNEFFQNEHGAIIIMDYVSGGNLQEAINNYSVSGQVLAGYFDDIVNGLAYIHSMGVVHRDLKPTNVLIGEDGGARIADFGLALLLNRDSTPLTQRGRALGTPHYAAPEQLKNAANVDQSADIHSLGLVAYEILTRRSPYSKIILSNYGPRLESVIGRCLEEDPRSRTVKPQELAGLLREYLTSEGHRA